MPGGAYGPMPPPGLGGPVGFIFLPKILKAVGGLFGGRRPPPGASGTSATSAGAAPRANTAKPVTTATTEAEAEVRRFAAGVFRLC